MDKMSQQLNATVPKGASKKVDLFAAKLIERHGVSFLDHLSKKHFANRNKAQQLVTSKYQ